jgi:hypothetical protein
MTKSALIIAVVAVVVVAEARTDWNFDFWSYAVGCAAGLIAVFSR